MLEELKIRYFSLHWGVRMLIVATLGSIPGVISYTDDAQILEADLEAAKSREANVRRKLANAKTQAKDLPVMEEKLAFTTDQLKKAESRLPSKVLVDQVLEQVGKAAKEADVQVKFFAPTGDKTIQGEYPYDEVRFNLKMSGKFPTLGKWMDLLAGFDSKAYIKRWNFKRDSRRKTVDIDPPSIGRVASNEPLPPIEVQKSKRELAIQDRDEYSVLLDTDVVFYRVASNVTPKTQRSGTPGSAEAAQAGQQPTPVGQQPTPVGPPPSTVPPQVQVLQPTPTPLPPAGGPA